MIGREGTLRADDTGAAARVLRIRELNDALRRAGRGGYVLVTQGLIGLGQANVLAAYQAIADYDAFNANDDPHGEHDFGAVEVAGQTVFWKIDYYDRTRTMGSPDPADPRVTVRVMTVMLAEEY